MTRRWLNGLALCGAVMTVGIAGCEREQRPFNAPRGARTGHVVAQASHQSQPSGVPPDSPYRRNAWGISEGKRLFSAYNCVGCHSHGGGGMGPALMDDRWIYGAEGTQIYQSIAQGRPNGMPSFGNRVPPFQIWMLVAYVQSISGNAPMDVLPGRSDQMQSGAPENARPAEVPRTTK